MGHRHEFKDHATNLSLNRFKIHTFFEGWAPQLFTFGAQMLNLDLH